MKIISRGFIPGPEANKHFNSNAFPCMVKLPSGRWLASFKAAEKKGDCDFMHAVMTWSDDEGQTWVSPFEPVQLPHINGIPGQSRLIYFLPLGGSRVLLVANWVDSSDVTLPYYDPSEESLKDTQIFYCFSEDDGETWSAPQQMDMGTIKDPVPLTGPPLILKDGTIICQFEINKQPGDKTPWVHKSALIYSSDKGKTWKDPVIVTNTPHMYYWDQRPNVMSDGKTIVDFFWTLDGKQNRYLNIHVSVSADAGKSWGPLWDTGIYGQPGQPVDLGDGRLATIEIDRSVKPVITVRASRDLGRNYDEALIVYSKDIDKQDSLNISMNDAWDEMVRFSVGHPNLINIGNGELLAYYYAGDHCDHTRIEFVRIATS